MLSAFPATLQRLRLEVMFPKSVVNQYKQNSYPGKWWLQQSDRGGVGALNLPVPSRLVAGEFDHVNIAPEDRKFIFQIGVSK